MIILQKIIVDMYTSIELVASYFDVIVQYIMQLQLHC